MGDTNAGQTTENIQKVETETVYDLLKQLEARIIKVENHVGIKNGTVAH